MKILKKIENDFFQTTDIENLPDTEKIILDVKKRGDRAVIEYSKKFKDGDFKCADDFQVTEEEIKSACKLIDRETFEALRVAIKNVKDFAKKQMSCLKNLDFAVEKTNNSLMGHKIIPLESVLCYVPGGNYPLLSSAFMCCIPALVAGVKNIYVTSPKILPETIVSAYLSGASKIYKIGGAQAISAFAYGTETLGAVDKIVGPGNKYVNYAKKYVYGTCGIDFIAGPSEVLVIADDTSDPKVVSADMLAQCEHDVNARAYLICFSEKFANEVEKEAQEQLKHLASKNIAEVSFGKSFAIILDDMDEIIKITNKRAPEHLELMFKDAEKYQDKFTNYGSLFVGSYCAEVFGDYCSGTNHVLPTNRVARYKGGLSVFDFVKIQTYQNIDCDYGKILSDTASKLAYKEGLSAHKLASDLRRGI